MKPSTSIIAFCLLIGLLMMSTVRPVELYSNSGDNPIQDLQNMLFQSQTELVKLEAINANLIEDNQRIKDSLKLQKRTSQSWFRQYMQMRGQYSRCSNNLNSLSLQNSSYLSNPTTRNTSFTNYEPLPIYNNSPLESINLKPGSSYTYPDLSEFRSAGYGVQLHAFKSLESALNFLTKHKDPQLFLRFKQNRFYAVVYGNFANRKTAILNANTLRKRFGIKKSNRVIVITHIE